MRARQARVSSTDDTALVRIKPDACWMVMPVRSGVSANASEAAAPRLAPRKLLRFISTLMSFVDLVRSGRRVGNHAHERDLDQRGRYFGTVMVVAKDVRNLGDEWLAVHHLAEDRIVPVPRRIFVLRDKELARGSSGSSIGHRQSAGTVELQSVDKLIGKPESAVVRPGRGGIASLNHEVRYHTMKD